MKSKHLLIGVPFLTLAIAASGCSTAPAEEPTAQSSSKIAPLAVAGAIITVAAVIDTGCDIVGWAEDLKGLAEYLCEHGNGDGTQDLCNAVAYVDEITSSQQAKQLSDIKEIVCHAAALVPGKGWVKKAAKYIGEEAAKRLAKKIWKDLQVVTCNEDYLEECGGGDGVCCDNICIEPNRLNGVNARCYNDYYGVPTEEESGFYNPWE